MRSLAPSSTLEAASIKVEKPKRAQDAWQHSAFLDSVIILIPIISSSIIIFTIVIVIIIITISSMIEIIDVFSLGAKLLRAFPSSPAPVASVSPGA